ncbi:hypothetical protein LguiB_026010 [Lonicera macranthoides]
MSSFLRPSERTKNKQHNRTMEFQLQKNKRKRTPSSQLRKKQRRKKEKRQIIESELLHIPQEIIDDILSRLPAKSLLRFKCVCKQWCSILSNPNFKKRETVLVFAMLSSVENTLFYSINDKNATLKAFPVPWDTKKDGFDRRVSISNSCNGLLLVRFDYSLFLFNPSTHYFVKVLTLNCLHDKDYRITMGLCYDESIDDYKAVIIRLPRYMPDYNDKLVIVASLKSKRWDEVRFPFNVRFVMLGPVVNKRLHWAVHDLNYNDYFPDKKKIIHFNPSSNKFGVLPSPKPKFLNKNKIIGLGILEGSLCMARGDNKNVFRPDVEILTMKEYGVAESWTTMFVLSNIPVNRYDRGLIPLLLTKDGEVLLLLKSDTILAYNLAKKSSRILRRWSLWDAVSLVESIVSPVGYYWDRMEHEDLGKEIKWQRG